jgi:ABC-type dipeptide/oligopeptide/nickel transport system permease component
VSRLFHRWVRTRYLLKRLAGTILTLLLLAATVFTLVKLIPGNEARVAAGPSATPAEVATVRLRLGLNHPVVSQFLSFLNRTIHGNLGTSISTNTSVASGITKVLPETVELVVLAVVLILLVTVPAAVVSAIRSGQRFDRVVSTAVVFGAGLPTFWVALLAQYWLGSRLSVLPISGELSRNFSVPTHTGFVLVDALLAGSWSAFFDALAHLILPATILAVSFGAQFYRSLRAELLQVLDREFVMLARAKGVAEWRVAIRHVLPNAAGPALTVLGILFGNMVGGAILVESVFGLPGIGAYLTNAVAQKDIFAVLGGVLVIGAIVVLANLLVDTVQLIRDPRIRGAEFGY